ncbi:SMI1/KNR4 family protein [Erwinia papayae]|uniref:SMI1/KNR4 family protein n=1 Tax=Erwinia papayae TaxID=206499 RepID=A0ABV3N6W1_9GAMM
MFLIESEKKLSAEDMKKFNGLFNGLLPQSFQDFYLLNNGGYPSDNEEGNFFMLNGFNPVTYGELPVEEIYKDILNGFPELRDMVPFAYDDGGNSFLLSLKDGDDFGKIFVLMMDEKELVEVADSFSSFLDDLKNPPDH